MINVSEVYQSSKKTTLGQCICSDLQEINSLHVVLFGFKLQSCVKNKEGAMFDERPWCVSKFCFRLAKGKKSRVIVQEATMRLVLFKRSKNCS